MVVVVASVGFATAGLWQLSRLDERRDRNAQVEASSTAQPVVLNVSDLPLPEFLPVTATGEWLGDAETAIPLQTRAGTAGVHLLTPLRTETGAVIVDRGWVPLDEVGDYPRPSGTATITATVRSVQSGRVTGGREGGRPSVSGRDPETIAELTGVPIEPVVLNLVTETPPTEPAPLPPLAPDLGEGSHLLYAIQWFSFIGIVIIGFAALLRKAR